MSAALWRLRWVSAAGRLVLAARVVRSFAQGLLSVLLPLFLDARGVTLSGLGLFLSAGVVGGAVYAIFLHTLALRLGRRATLVGLTTLTALAGYGLLVSDALAWLLACAFVGSLAGVGGAGGAGPAQPLEQAILADACAPERRGALFAAYRFGSTLALAFGGLAAGIPSLLSAAGFSSETAGLDAMIALFASCVLIVAALYTRLPAEADAERRGERAWANPLRTPSRRLILGLNALFSVDQLGSSLTTASLMTWWFHTRLGLELAELAALSFAAQLLSAVSMWLSVWLAARIGYVRTMVFTHVPASAMLVALAFAPSAGWGIALWLGRGLLAQMDIPARDALTMSVVRPDERVAMASLHLVGRNGMGTVGPALSTTIWQALSPAAPLVLGGLLKIAYDASLYLVYRDLDPARAEDPP